MNGANITCFMQQTAWLVVGLVAIVLPYSVADRQSRLNDGSDLKLLINFQYIYSGIKLLIKLVGALRSIFGRAPINFGIDLWISFAPMFHCWFCCQDVGSDCISS